MGDSFQLEALADNTYPAGEASKFSITVEGRGAWHVNQDYPIAVKLEGPAGVGLGKQKLERRDAAAFTEQNVRFDIPFKPTEAGSHDVRADVSFAMCTKENCILEDRKLAFALQVK